MKNPRLLIPVRCTTRKIFLQPPETALQLLTDLDYNIIDWFYTAVALDLPSANLKNVIMRIPRRLLYSINMDVAVRLLGGYRLLVLTK
jgi:hypothetical protein